MSSSKNHTKNELARISAKIQQLKKKYPVGPQLYMSHEKDSHRLEGNALQEIRLPVNNQSQTSNQRILRPKSISHTVKNKQLHETTKQQIFSFPQSYESSQRDSIENINFVSSSLNSSVKNVDQRSQSHQSLSSSGQSQSFQLNFMKQKPYKEYKEQLKHLKKQILSGLDITNFPIKRQNQIKNPTISNQPYETFNKNSFQQMQTKERQNMNKENHDKFNEPTISEIKEYKNRLIQNRNKKEITQVKFTQTKEFMQMKESIQKLTEQVQKQRSQFQQRLSKLEFHSHSINGQTQQLRNQLKFLQEKLQQCLPSQKKLSQYDLKVVEIQNQSINKLSKDLYKEIQAINSELNDIKEIQFNSVKSTESIFEKDQIEQIVIGCLQNNFQQMTLSSQQRIKQVQNRFFREMFDIKNQIQLLSEKLKKQDYLQKTIKQLLPNKNKNKQEEITEIIDRVKVQLSKDKGFLNHIYSTFEVNIDKKIPKLDIVQGRIQQISSRLENFNILTQQTISQSYKKVKDEIGSFVMNELGFFSTSLKQFETKMTSYGILIQHLEEAMRQISLQINHDIEQNHKQNEKVQIQTKQIISAQTENIQSRSLTSIQNHQLQAHKSQYANSSLQNSKFSHITLPYCLIEETKKQQDEFFITKLGESKMSEIKNCQKGFLLEDLVKNSLVFSALNN